MPRLLILSAAFAFELTLALCVTPALAQHSHGASSPAQPGHVPLYSDLGSWSHRVTSGSPAAQKYFDQGLRLYYGFNQDEATRAFREAARLDPRCAMAWWGVALAAGPNINLPMDEAHARTALEAIARAAALAKGASPSERAYIAAQLARYSARPSARRGALDSAYCDAMRRLAQRFPVDPDAAVLFAESILDLNPWNQWAHDGAPNPGTLEAVATLEAVLARHPAHPGANHFYVHAVEASDHPERALAAAKRLETLVPGAGHLVHMPSHIYARTGQYREALEQNRRAVAVDEKYIAEQQPEGVYPLMYYNHNIQFIWFSAMQEGRSAKALGAARKIVGNIPPELLAQMSMLELAPPLPIMTLVRFGRWDEALKEPGPPASERYARGVWHYARGMAFAGKGDLQDAQTALDSLRAATLWVPADMMISINYAAPLLRVARSTLAGEIAARYDRNDVAVRLLQIAVAQEDSLHYDEPPTWYYPVRHSLGAVLLKAGRAKEAEAVYREDLRRHPENGWSLVGLSKALAGQGRAKEAAVVDERFRKAWSEADVKLTASEF
jgi:tetratricopeptide (TPR) repeat protein